MELRQLRYFVAVAEELNFGRAAGRVYLSQPALSQQIQKLEEDLGVTLFHRTKRRVELTEAGQVLLEGAHQVLMQVEQTVRVVREAGGAESSRLRVGFPEYANHTSVAEILQAFRKRYPDVELEEHEMFLLQQTPRQVSGLRNGTLDVGFLLLPVDDDALALERVLRIELVAALPEGHPLTAGKEVPMRALVGERLILFSRRFHPNSYDYIVDCCKEAGFSPNVVQRNEPQLYSGPTTYRMVASGAGIGIVVPPLALGSRLPGVVFRPLREPTPTLDLVAAWRRNDSSPNLRAFLEVVREFAPVDIRASDSRLLPNSYASFET
jgi:DNA-binding transcriptional LysR family regulator